MDNTILTKSLLVLTLASLTAANVDQTLRQDNVKCLNSAVDYNVTLSKGGKSGKFYQVADISKIDDCISKCCDTKKCNIALLVKKTCYMVECYSQESCEVQQANKLKLGTVLSVVKKKSNIAGNKTAEPAVEENLAETSPYVKDDGMTTISAFGTGKYKRTKRSSDIIDLVVAVGCGTVAVAVGVAGVIMMTRRLIDNSKNSAA